MRKQKHIRQSAGGILWKKKEDEIYVISHKIQGFALPKGRREKGEELIDTAVREVREETGYEVAAPLCFLGKTRYTTKAGKVRSPKEVYYFVFPVPSEAPQYDLQLEKYEPIGKGIWVTPQKAQELLKFKSDKQLVEKFIHVKGSLGK